LHLGFSFHGSDRFFREPRQWADCARAPKLYITGVNRAKSFKVPLVARQAPHDARAAGAVAIDAMVLGKQDASRK
jgi:hypothetical protein